MTTLTKSECNIIFPPGNLVPTTPEARHVGTIVLSETPNLPLVPHVKVTKIDNETLEIKSIVFVNTTLDRTPDFLVNQLFSINSLGQCQLQFFIHCSEEQILEIMDDQNHDDIHYQAFSVVFRTSSTEGFPDKIKMSDIKFAQTFLWNIDPETSRGTETVVQTTQDNPE